MTTLVIPAAGRSTRFNSSRPKYMLTAPDVNGDIMLVQAIKGINFENISRLVITVVREHIEKNQLNLPKLKNRIFELKNIEPEILIIDNFTSSQSETVHNTIVGKNIKGPFVVKDCDNYFSVKLEDKNSICVSKLKAGINAVNKSYVSLDKFGQVSGIVEKTVIGNTFCVGGYSFADAQKFVNVFNKIQGLKKVNQTEIYISHCIGQMLLDGEIFDTSEVDEYLDWGDAGAWETYCKQYKTIFCDIDGVIAQNSADFFTEEFGSAPGLQENINTLNNLYDSGKIYIVLTTARREEHKDITIEQLGRLGVKFHKIIMGLPHCQRILINDYASTNPYPSATAINLKRNSDNLKELI